MPIAFRDAIDVGELGSAAYLTIVSGDGSELLGALFSIDARGEPLEFGYNRVDLPDTFLWRRSDLRRHAERTLAASLLRVCSRTPRILLCLADAVGSDLFCQDLALELPVGRIAQPLHATSYSPRETLETYEEPEPLQLFWFSAPAADSLERRLFERLRTHGLLLEPFERASTGLLEIFSSSALDEPTA